jgi:hypothetical protein
MVEEGRCEEGCIRIGGDRVGCGEVECLLAWEVTVGQALRGDFARQSFEVSATS